MFTCSPSTRLANTQLSLVCKVQTASFDQTRHTPHPKKALPAEACFQEAFAGSARKLKAM